MRKTVLITAISSLCISLSMPVFAAPSATLDQRVDRLERMMENPVLLQLSRRLGEQQRDIQSLQDENDRLKRELNQLRTLMDKRYKENDDRFSALEGGQSNLNSSVKSSIPVIENDVVISTDGNAVEPAVVPVLEAQSVPSVNAESVEEEKLIEALATSETSEKPLEDKVQTSNKDLADAQTQKSIITRPATESEKEKYKSAFALMRASKYDDSISEFQTFIQQHPESELASNAAYWSGEGYLIKNQNQKALDAFLMVINRYPESSKVPDATLRAGDSYERIGDKQQAAKLYQQVIDSRPTSRAAKNAKKRLEKM